MADKLCDICGVRPASVRVTVVQNGARQEMGACDYDYTQQTRHQKYVYPLEPLFGGDDPFGGFFDRAGGMLGRTSIGSRRSGSARYNRRTAVH